MVINKYLHKSVSSSFNLNLNETALKRVKTIKYLGISIDETLTWSSYITQLTLAYYSSDMLAFFTDYVVMLLVKPSVCNIIPWFRARYNME